MTMIKSEIEAQITLNLGNRTELNIHRLTWLNWALEDTASVRNWNSMKEWDKNSIRTVEGQMAYPFPAQTKDVMSVKFANDSDWQTPPQH